MDWNNTKVVSGDFSGDGKVDVAALYNYSSSCSYRSGLLVWVSSGSSFAPPASWYDSGCNAFDWTKSKLATGDFNFDFKTDIAILYDESSTCSDESAWLVFRSYGAGFSGWYTWWNSGCHNFTWSKAKVLGGDFNGDGYADAAALYDYSSTCAQDIAWLGFASNGSSFPGWSTYWPSGCNSGFNWSKTGLD